MTKVTWDVSGERLYQVGIDRGMIYLDDGSVSPWNGLVSVTESPSGGAPTETFLDGQKILDIPVGEDYTATIEALSLPVSAASCAGWGILQYGLYASNQPKQMFAFSYRTLIGNDVKGTKFGYRVHIVFGCLARSSNFTHETSNDKQSVKSYSWAITAIPVSFGIRKPTAHVIFDTRVQDLTTIATLEAILYGDDVNNPRLPLPSEIAILLS